MKKLAIFLLILSFAGIAFTQTLVVPEIQFRHKLKGTVKDQMSAVYSGITLYFNSEQMSEVNSRQRSEAVSTNINGEFAIDLPSGKYTVKVNEINSGSFIAFINIEEDGLNPNDVEFMIDSSNAYCGEASLISCPKIVKSAKADYPPAARAVRASGEVVVAITIDKAGNVLTAKAESGNPLLRASSVKAARSFLFEPSDSNMSRDAKLVFVFLIGVKEKEGISRYSNPYRFEVIAAPETIQY